MQKGGRFNTNIDEVQFTEPSVQNQNKIRDFLKQKNIKNSNQDREQQDFFFNLNFNGEYEKAENI